MTARQPLFPVDTGVSAYEKAQVASITPRRGETPASFAMSALVNLGTCSLDELKALTCELARVARDVSQDTEIDASTMEPVLEALDSASDLLDEVHVRGCVCVTCSGTGEGRWAGTRCHKCGGTGGAQ